MEAEADKNVGLPQSLDVMQFLPRRDTNDSLTTQNASMSTFLTWGQFDAFQLSESASQVPDRHLANELLLLPATQGSAKF